MTSDVLHFESMEFFHVMNRGVDKRDIFMDERDYLRFIHDLFEFNDEELSENMFRSFNKMKDIGCQSIYKKPRKLLVSIHAFCLMPNHYHLLLSPFIEGGISKFMQKINMGYSKYFNIKYKREGALFQGKYKTVNIQRDEYFAYLLYYIHFNPLDLKFPEWRDYKIRSRKDALNFLESYRWSSHLDYLGKGDFPSVTKREFLLEYLEGTVAYKDKARSFLNSFNIAKIKKFIFE